MGWGRTHGGFTRPSGLGATAALVHRVWAHNDLQPFISILNQGAGCVQAEFLVTCYHSTVLVTLSGLGFYTLVSWSRMNMCKSHHTFLV